MKIVAVDGLAGSGKSTVSQLIAERFDWLHFSTGIIYRAIAVIVRRLDLATSDESTIGKMLEQEMPTIGWNFVTGNAQIIHRTIDITNELQATYASELASVISAWPAVRRPLLAVQREIVSSTTHQGAIVDGRDVGTVVFPDADVKIFMVADLAQRAERRAIDNRYTGVESPRQLATRDQRDSKRQLAPLKMADDALKFDTTDLTAKQSSTILSRLIAERLGVTLS